MSDESTTYEDVIRPEVKVILEQGSPNWSAYVPSIPGCVSTGKDRDQVMRNISDALSFHLAGLHEDALRVHDPLSRASA
jgi:predicted RNase H-like HicB family nuclease